MNKRSSKRRKKIARTPLNRRVQLVSAEPPRQDKLDDDVASYVAPFMKSLSEQLSLERIDLRTKESAADSLSYLEGKLAYLQRQHRTAQSLRRLLEDKKAQLLDGSEFNDEDREHH